MQSIEQFVISYIQKTDLTSIEQKLWSERQSSSPVRLHCNETPIDLPLELKQQLAAKMAELSWNRYPDFYNTELTKLVAESIGFQVENIVLGNGSSQLIQQIVSCYSKFLSTAIIEQPTFTYYHQVCPNERMPYQEWAITEDGKYNLATFPQVSEPALVILTSPNNPTGATLPLETLKTLFEEHPNCIFVVDEAYGDFGGESAMELINKYANLLVIRTLSKGQSLPSIRFGYVVGSPLLIQLLKKYTVPFTINIFTEVVVREFLTNPTFANALKANRERVINLREFVYHLLNNIAQDNNNIFTVLPSATNFLLLRLQDALLLEKIKQVLNARNILVSFPLPQCLRVTIGTEAEMHQVVRLIKNTISQHRQCAKTASDVLSA